jgi:hypothetical protein
MDHGVATFPQDGEQADQLIRVADERLYRLKHANHRKLGNGAATAAPAAISAPVVGPATPPAATVTPAVVTPAAAPAVTSVPQEPEETKSPAPERTAVTTEPISIDSGRAPEKHESAMAAAASAGAAEISSTPVAIEPSQQQIYAMQRKAERVSMTGTNAYAMLGEQNSRRARVIDLGFGGVAIELEKAETLPDNILAILHVPILPPVRVSLKPVWTQQTKQGAYRIGCAFIS